MDRRSFVWSACGLTATKLLPASTATPALLMPTLLYDKTTRSWAPLEGGLLNIKSGQIFRLINLVTGAPLDFDVHRCGGVGVACEDGRAMLDRDGNTCGGCESNFYNTLEDIPEVAS